MQLYVKRLRSKYVLADGHVHLNCLTQLAVDLQANLAGRIVTKGIELLSSGDKKLLGFERRSPLSKQHVGGDADTQPVKDILLAMVRRAPASGQLHMWQSVLLCAFYSCYETATTVHFRHVQLCCRWRPQRMCWRASRCKSLGVA